MDDEGNPAGYRVVTGVDQLNADDQVVFVGLKDRFRFKDVLTAFGGKSGSNADRFVKKCCSLQILRRDGPEYVKVSRMSGGTGEGGGTQ